jgi:hypothetical protein
MYDLLPNDERILTNLASYHGENGIICPSLNTVSKQLSISKRYIIDRLTHLQSLGLIKINKKIKHNGEFSNNSYELLFAGGSEPENTTVVNPRSPPSEPEITTQDRGVVNHSTLPPSDLQFTTLVNPRSPGGELQCKNIKELTTNKTTKDKNKDIAQSAFAHDKNAQIDAQNAQLCASENAQDNAQCANETCANLEKKINKRFEDFWNAYPRKKDKQRACKIWQRKKLDAKADFIIAHVIHRTKHDEQWQDEKYIPHPSTFLNGERWQDEVKEPDSETNAARQTNNGNNGFQRKKSRSEETWDFLTAAAGYKSSENPIGIEIDLSEQIPKLVSE